MTTSQIRAVYDCNILLQSLLYDGPSYRCMQYVEQGRVVLFANAETREEVRDVLRRPKLLRKYPQLTPDRIAAFHRFLDRTVLTIDNVPALVQFPRDLDDEVYLNLALASRASFLVTRDQKHLLAFAKESTPDALAFRQHNPRLQIIDPVEFLRQVDRVQPPTA